MPPLHPTILCNCPGGPRASEIPVVSPISPEQRRVSYRRGGHFDQTALSCPKLRRIGMGGACAKLHPVAANTCSLRRGGQKSTFQAATGGFKGEKGTVRERGAKMLDRGFTASLLAEELASLPEKCKQGHLVMDKYRGQRGYILLRSETRHSHKPRTQTLTHPRSYHRSIKWYTIGQYQMILNCGSACDQCPSRHSILRSSPGMRESAHSRGDHLDLQYTSFCKHLSCIATKSSWKGPKTGFTLGFWV